MTRHTSTGRTTAFVNSAGIYLVVILLVIVGAFASPEFLDPTKLLGMVQNVALLGIVAVGVSFVTYSGHYADLSVPSIMALSGIVSVSALRWGFVPGVLAGVASGLGVGAINGWVIGYLRANPIIWTLVTAAAGDGFIRWAYSNTQAYPDTTTAAGKTFVELFGAKLLGVLPMTLVVLTVLLATGQLILKATRYGAQLKLVGSSYEVARMTGVNVRSITLRAFLLSAFAASVGGIMLTSLNKVGAVYIGKGYDFMAVTAVVIGGVSLAGGRGNILGVLGGVLTIGLMSNIMTLSGFGTFQQDVVQGIVFIAVVGTNAYFTRRAGRDDS